MCIRRNSGDAGLYNGGIAIFKNACLIYNPCAGKLQRSPKLLDQAVEVLRRAGHQLTLAPTEGPRTASAIAARCRDAGADLVLVAGGDGTINEVLNGLSGSRTPLALLPLGTANVLGVELKIGTDPVRAARELADCEPQRIGLGLLRCGGEERRFALMAGVGLDAMIVYNIHAGLKAALGKGAYWLAGLSRLGRRLPEFTATVNGRDYRVSFALVSRVRNYGGDLEIARGACLLKEEFEAVLFEGSDSLPYAKYLAGVLTGRLGSMKGVTILRTRSMTLSPGGDPRVYVQVDGEYAGTLPATIEMLPEALTLLMPPSFVQVRRAALAS